MNIEQRIAQFENMCREDPTNDMAHFSLGGAYNQAGRFGEAARAFLAAIDQNRNLSKAYQMAGAALMACGNVEDAAEVLTRGYNVAGQRGDRMPQQAIGELLTKLGKSLPEVATEEPAAAGGDFVCRRTGKPGTRLARPPFRGPVGRWIFENISAETFDAWIRQGTKVINELRLDLSRDQDAASYDQHMREYLGIDEDILREISAGAATKPGA